MVIDCTSCGAPIFATDTNCDSCGADNPRYVDPHTLRQAQKRQMILGVITASAVGGLVLIGLAAAWPDAPPPSTEISTAQRDVNRALASKPDAIQQVAEAANAQHDYKVEEALGHNAEEAAYFASGDPETCGPPPRFDEEAGGYTQVEKYVGLMARAGGSVAVVQSCGRVSNAGDRGWKVRCTWHVSQSDGRTVPMLADAYVCAGVVREFSVIESAD